MQTTQVAQQPQWIRRGLHLAYRIATPAIALWMIGSGTASLLGLEFMTTAIDYLGYPAYFHLMLGVAKTLGGLALVLPAPRTLREWAYAGVTFETLAAVVSYASVGAPLPDVLPPAVALMLVLVGYVAWRTHELTIEPTPL